MDGREQLKNKRRIVIKIGSSSLTIRESGHLDLRKIEKLVRVICQLRGEGKDVVLVSSGAIAVGRQALGVEQKPEKTSEKQALAAVGQARLMMTYQRLFAEYNQTAAQVLLTKYSILDGLSRLNAKNTFEELLKLGVVPVVNENDTVATHEIEFGDNDRLSAIVAGLVGADLLILLSDIDGLYTDDPNQNQEAMLIQIVSEITEDLLAMGKESSGSSLGTGGMQAKLMAARMATDAGADMVIANGADVENIYRIMEGEPCGTLFLAHKNKNFDLYRYVERY
ncbi:MAG: glutamate 5-kinase [Lachnospiraceae bacterium]|nr:glutamate 5-kinase [Lachnospiraceae bacterium]